MNRNHLLLPTLCAGLMLLGAARCGSDPNLEGARLDLRNKDYDRGLENISKALEKDPNNSEAHELKGAIVRELVLETENPEERAALVEEMAVAYRQSVVLDPSRTQAIELQLQTAYLQEFNAGIEAYSEAQHADTEDVKDAFQVAAMHFRNASVVMPDSVSAYVNEASAHFSGGRFDLAVQAYEAAIGMGHTQRQVYVYLARVLDLMAQQNSREAGRAQLYQRAVRVLKSGLQHHEGDGELRDMLLNYYALADQPQEAVAFFESQLDEKHSDAVFLYNYGTLLLREQDYSRAVAMLTEAVRVDPSYTKARFNLGAALINQGVGVAEAYRATSDSLDNRGRMLPASSVVRMEARMNSLDTRRKSLFHAAIVHLEKAKSLAEEALEQPRDICRALYRAYGHTNQQSKADAVAECAAWDGL